ncbi:hypothetical protein RKD55_000394 [Rossellomorea marisflavi]
MKKFILSTVTAMILVLGFAGTTSAAVIQPLKEFPYNDY